MYDSAWIGTSSPPRCFMMQVRSLFIKLIGICDVSVMECDLHCNSCSLSRVRKVRASVTWRNKPPARITNNLDCRELFAARIFSHFIQDQLAQFGFGLLYYGQGLCPVSSYHAIHPQRRYNILPVIEHGASEHTARQSAPPRANNGDGASGL